jgi:hypothetical protein
MRDFHLMLIEGTSRISKDRADFSPGATEIEESSITKERNQKEAKSAPGKAIPQRNMGASCARLRGIPYRV